MLAIRSRLPPVDGPSLIGDLRPLEGDVLAIAFHRQLLQVGRKALQILFVGQNRHGLRAEEIVVPETQKPHEHRQIAIKRRGAKVLIHSVKTIEHGTEMFGADRNHGRETDRRVHGIAAADPSQNSNMFEASMPNFVTSCALVDSATKCRATAAGSFKVPRTQSRAVCALVIVSRVVKVFEATMNKDSAGSRSRVASKKSVPSMLETKRKVRSR